MKTKTLLSTAVLLALGTLAGCGGGSSGGATRIGGSQVTGVISAIDTPAQAGVVAGAAPGGNTQVTVNNVTYTLDDNVNIQVENAAGDASALAEGQVVTMETATDGSGGNLVTAISLADEVEGVVFSNNTANSTMNVMGLEVQYTANTKFESDDRSMPADPAAIGQGWVVEVHGFPSDTGIVATRIEVKSNNYMTCNDEFELKGTITTAATNAITIGTQDIDTTGANVSDMPTQTSSWTGMYVEVKTDRDHIVLGDPGTITATKVEPEERDSDRDHDDDDDEVEIEGVLDYDGGVVKINGEVINVSDSISRDTLTWFDGKLVEVEGRYVNGELVIYEIELED